MTDIDTATGLPKLPKDSLFFRVSHNHVEIRRSVPDRDIPEESYTTWWGKKVITQTARRIEGESQHVTWGAIADPDSESGVELIVDSWSLRFRGVTGAKRITRDNVVEVAKIALEKYEDSLLYGDYPPKSL